MNHQCSIREDVNGRNSRFGQLRQEAISSRQVGATPRRGELHEIHNPRIVNFCLKGIRIYDNVFRSEAEMQDRGWEVSTNPLETCSFEQSVWRVLSVNLLFLPLTSSRMEH